MKTLLLAKTDLTKDANNPTVTIVMYKTENDKPIARFVLLADGIWKKVAEDEPMPENCEIPLVTEGE